MIEAYKIGVSLVLESNMSSLGQLAEAMRKLDDVVKDASKSMEGLAAQLRVVAGAERGIRTLAETMTRLADATRRAADNAKALGQMAPGSANEAERAASAWERTANAMARARSAGSSSGGGSGGPRTGLMGPGTSLVPYEGFDEPFGAPIPLNTGTRPSGHPDFAGAAMVTGAGAFGAWEVLKHVFEAGGNRDKLLTDLALQGWTPEQAQQALGVATEQQRSIPGTTIDQSIQVMRDLSVVMRDKSGNPDVGAVLGAAPGFLRMATVLGAVGEGDQIAELFKAIQSGELKGRLSPEQMGNFLSEIENTAIITGGRIGPAQILQFLKSSGVSGATLGDATLFGDAIAPMLSMGAAGAGTGLQGFYRQFAVGRMSEATVKLLEQMGIITDTSKVHKVGIGQVRVDPGGMPAGDEDLIMRNAPEYLRTRLLPQIRAYDLKHYGMDNAELEQKTAEQITSNIPGGKFLADMIRLLSLMEKLKAGEGAASQRDAYGIEVSGNPMLQQQAVGAAFNGLLQAMANPDVMKEMVGFLRDATDLLNKFADVAKAHPGATKDALETIAVLGVVSTALSGLFTVLFGYKVIAGTLEWLVGAKALGGLAEVAGKFAAGTSAFVGLSGVVGLLLKLWSIAQIGSEFQTPETQKKQDDLSRQRRSDPMQAPSDGYGPDRTPVHKSGYIQFHSTINIDGRAVAHAVTYHQNEWASGPAIGPTGYDPSVTPLHTSHLIPA